MFFERVNSNFEKNNVGKKRCYDYNGKAFKYDNKVRVRFIYG